MTAVKRINPQRKNSKTSLELKNVGVWNKGRNVTTTNVDLTFRRGEKIRTRKFVKREVHGASNRSKYLHKNPKEQVKTRKQLIADVKKNKLGVDVIPTFRLVEEKGRPVIIASKLDVVRREEISAMDANLRNNLINGLSGKIKDLKEIGWHVPMSEFAFVRLKTKRGSVVLSPMIVDFSKVFKLK